jgi:hypothetical protein
MGSIWNASDPGKWWKNSWTGSIDLQLRKAIPVE